MLLRFASHFFLCALCVVLHTGCAGEVKPLLPQPTASAFLRMATAEQDVEKRRDLAAAYLASFRAGAPYPPYEEGKVFFFYWDEKNIGQSALGLAIEAHAWNADKLPFARLADTPLFYQTLECNERADFVYWIVARGVWKSDPFNPLRAPDPHTRQASRVDLARRR